MDDRDRSRRRNEKLIVYRASWTRGRDHERYSVEGALEAYTYSDLLEVLHKASLHRRREDRQQNRTDTVKTL